ncbi:MAG: SRPBCC family protein [Armatimonadetes bacterium]|nr:SRPBCC family protein [Armatimonadota bacterium]
MASIEQTTRIQAPIEAVFEFLAHPENNKEWIPDVIESRKLTDGPNGPGARFRFVSRAPLGLPVWAEAEITEMEPPRRLAFCSTRGVQHCGRWDLEPENGGTRVRFRIDYRLSGIEAMVLRAAGLPRFLERHVRGSIEGLKHALENGKPAAPPHPKTRIA